MNINKDNSLNSKVKLSCKKEGGKTLLDERYFDIPYKLTHYGSPLKSDVLEMILMCSSPGVMDGDGLTLDVECQEGAELKFFTQSYNKIHPMPKGQGATQLCRYHIGKAAKFMYIPHPSIPYKDSLFSATNDIHLHSTSHLIWSDIISGGRIYSGERFLLKKYHTKTKIYRDEKLILFDNQLIQPGAQPLEDLLFFEGYTHQGTLLIVSPFAEDLKKELDEMLLEQFTDSSYGFTLCAENALMLRVMGSSGDAIHNWLARIGDMAWQYFSYRENTEVNKENKPGNIAAASKPTSKSKKAVSKGANNKKKILKGEPSAKKPKTIGKTKN